MSKEILIKIRDKIADRISGEYVCGNSDFVAVFDFDEEWNAYETKTARFYYGDNYIDKPFNGDRCEIPILSNIHSFEVGVFAGNLKTSTSEYVPARKSILCKGGSPAAPSPDVYAQIMEMLRNIDHMSEEEIAKAIKEYLSENGIDIDLEGVPHVYTTTEKPTDAKHGDFWARKVEVPDDAPSKDPDVPLPDGTIPDEKYVTEDAMHEYVRTMISEIEPEDIGAMPANTEIPKNMSDLNNDSGFLTEEDLPDYTAADIGCDITVDDQKCENVGAALNALANRGVGGSSENPMPLIYDKTFEQVNAFSDTCEELKDYKKLIWELKVFDRTEAISLYFFDVANITCLYGNKFSCSTAYPWGCATGEIEKYDDNVIYRRSYHGGIAQSPGGAGGMSGTAAIYTPKQETKINDTIELAFLGENMASVQLRIWGC